MYYYVFCIVCMDRDKTVSIKLKIDILIIIPFLLLLFMNGHKIYSLSMQQAILKLYNIKLIPDNHQI